MEEKPGALTLVKDSLEVLASIREQTGSWLDSEQEEPEQSFVFKTMEGLEPFFLANQMFPVDFSRLPLEEGTLLGDLNRVIDVVEREGFSPSPYLYVREKAEFVDAAALSLRLMFMIGNYINRTVLKKNTKWAKLLDTVPKIAYKAYDLILKTAMRDKTGVRWAGTEMHAIKRANYCNVYFTSEAVKSLVACTVYKDPVTVGDEEKTKEAIRESCRWLLGRVKDNTVFGDENKTRGEINYSFYGLNALFDCFEYLEERQKAVVRKVFAKFVDKVKDGDEGSTWLNYIDVPLKGYARPIFYDDRAGYGNIVTVLCKGRDIFRDDPLINNRFFEILNLWYRSLINQRDSETQLWEQGNFLICYTARAIESLLYFAKYGEAIKYELSEQEALEALRRTLDSVQIQQIFLREIARVGGVIRKETE